MTTIGTRKVVDKGSKNRVINYDVGDGRFVPLHYEGRNRWAVCCAGCDAEMRTFRTRDAAVSYCCQTSASPHRACGMR